jgi:hypothetical protein
MPVKTVKNWWPVVFILIIIGCSEDPVKKDLINYLNNELPRVHSQGKEAVEAFHEVMDREQDDDFTKYRILNDEVMPKFLRYMQVAEEIRPNTKEVRDLHESLIEGVTIQSNAMHLALDALKRQDHRTAFEADQEFAKGDRLIRSFNFELESLCQKHKLEISRKPKYDPISGGKSGSSTD